ncbi:MAG: 5-formyltetrahydrofolate cyclo-ligase [Candidatus Brocadiales bacterium]|nr:5-formyltetrahydrofolate cyclo-ligase [Candidatus Brocadiales bacterium]
MGLRTKESVRQAVWSYLEEAHIADFPRPCFGRIPNFAGSREACERLLTLEDFKRARCVFSAPDYVLKKARDLVLKEGKTLAFATPHMRAFLEIEPHQGKVSTTIRNMARLGRPLKTPVELILQGSVAVDRKGNRLGKGKGYGDKEVDWLKRHSLLAPGAPVVTIVHSSQIVEDLSNLMGKDDVPVDYILTEKEIIKCR